MTVTTPKTLPQANGDFYAIHSTLSEEDQALLRRVRAFLEAEVAPVITEYWIREEFPYQLLPKAEKLKNKIALRVVQNGLITLEDCRVPEANRLQKANSFRDTAAV